MPSPLNLKPLESSLEREDKEETTTPEDPVNPVRRVTVPPVNHARKATVPPVRRATVPPVNPVRRVTAPPASPVRRVTVPPAVPATRTLPPLREVMPRLRPELRELPARLSPEDRGEGQDPTVATSVDSPETKTRDPEESTTVTLPLAVERRYPREEPERPTGDLSKTRHTPLLRDLSLRFLLLRT